MKKTRKPTPRLQTLYPGDLLSQERHHAYNVARSQAKFRMEPFELTREEYFNLWNPSAWHMRGRGANDLVLVREDVTGPWAVWNCKIITRVQNICRNNARKIGRPRSKSKLIGETNG